MLRSVLCSCIHFENCENFSLLKAFLPSFQAKYTEVMRFMIILKVSYVYYVFLNTCLVANFKQPLRSIYSFV